MVDIEQYTIFKNTVRISDLDPFDKDAIWPHNIEVCIARIPIRKRDNYSAEYIKKLGEKLKNHMVKNGIVFLVCYAPIEKKSRPFEVASIMEDCGFNHIDNIVIQKTWFPGKRSENTLVNSHEYVLHFCNGNVWKLDRLPIMSYLNANTDTSCPGNIWKVNTGSLDEAYPLDLAELLLRMTDCLPGSIVFDPFMGTQSSLIASLKLGHSYYGFEKNAKRIVKYKKIIKDFEKGEL